MGNCVCNDPNSECNPLQIEREQQEEEIKKELRTDTHSPKSSSTDESKNKEEKKENAVEHEDSASDFDTDEDDKDTVADIKSGYDHNAKPEDHDKPEFKRRVSSKLDLPLTFEEIKQYVATDRTEEFKRNPKYDKLYAEHRVNTKEKYGSIYDKIMAVEMEYPTKTNEDGKLIVIREENDEKTVFAENLFPYFIEDDIEHNLVFSTFKDGLTDEEVNEFLKKHIDHDVYDVFWYENPPHMRSLPLLWHVQVFSRPKRTAS